MFAMKNKTLDFVVLHFPISIHHFKHSKSAKVIPKSPNTPSNILSSPGIIAGLVAAWYCVSSQIIQAIPRYSFSHHTACSDIASSLVFIGVKLLVSARVAASEARGMHFPVC